MMKDLKAYIRESILDDIDDQIENTDEIIKNNIINWLKDNIESLKENKLNFDFSTKPVTVNYDGDIEFKRHITSLTNGSFQWGEIKKYFNCSFCKSLKSLMGAPREVGWSFDCSFCDSLKSLEGAPMKVETDFYCNNCKSLTSLEGAPKEIGCGFSCENCKSLTSLEGAPKEVGEYFECSKCKSLKSLKGAPKNVGTWFECYGCGKNFTEDDVKKVSNVKGEINC